jgi:cold shock CspA family protein
MAEVPQRRIAAFHQAGSAERIGGIITRWQDGETYGFITSEDQVTYFLSESDLPRGVTCLPVGTVVSFTAATNPQPGKRHPRAKSVRLAGDV